MRLILKVDPHVHTMWSGDSTTTPEELIAAVAGSDLAAICVTDHNTIAGALSLSRSGEVACHVVVGEEIRTVDGDLIGLFLDERVPAGLRPAEAASLVRDQGGLVYVPHPGDGARHSLSEGAISSLAGEGLLDIVEVLNAKCPSPYAGPVHGAAQAGASDAHVPDAVGAAWTDIPACDLAEAGSFLEAFRHGAPGGGHFDPARTWRPRVLPSGLTLDGRG